MHEAIQFARLQHAKFNSCRSRWLPSPQDTEDGCRPQHNDVLGFHHNLEIVCSNLTD